MNYQERLTTFLSTCAGKVLNVFFEIYTILDSLDPDEQSNALMFLCENVFVIDSDESKRIDKEYYTDVQVERAQKKINHKFRPWIDRKIMDCIEQKVCPELFYKQIWSSIQSKEFFATKRERALALFTLADNRLIPYRNVGIGISVSKDEYNEIYDKISEKHLPDTRYILEVPYDQKTQRASLIVDMLDSLDSIKERAVLLSVVMNQIERNVKNKVQEAIEEA